MNKYIDLERLANAINNLIDSEAEDALNKLYYRNSVFKKWVDSGKQKKVRLTKSTDPCLPRGLSIVIMKNNDEPRLVLKTSQGSAYLVDEFLSRPFYNQISEEDITAYIGVFELLKIIQEPA